MDAYYLILLGIAILALMLIGAESAGNAAAKRMERGRGNYGKISLK